MAPHTHEHNHAHDSSDRRLLMAIGVNVFLTIVEIVGGVLSGSLSLIADALHNLSDAGSLLVAFISRKVSAWPSDSVRTFGYKRAEVVGSLINLTTLMVVGFYLIIEAVSRYLNPEPVVGWIMIWVSGIALVVDLITAALTFAMAKESLNIRAAFIHNVSDALGSIAVIIAGSLIILYEFHLADVIATLLIAGYVLYQGALMMPQAIRVLMDSVPDHIDIDDVASAVLELENVKGVHHLHVWQLGENVIALEAHISVRPDTSLSVMEGIKRDIKGRLSENFRIDHAILEFEPQDEDGNDACDDNDLVAPQ